MMVVSLSPPLSLFSVALQIEPPWTSQSVGSKPDAKSFFLSILSINITGTMILPGILQSGSWESSFAYIPFSLSNKNHLNSPKSFEMTFYF